MRLQQACEYRLAAHLQTWIAKPPNFHSQLIILLSVIPNAGDTSLCLLPLANVPASRRNSFINFQPNSISPVGTLAWFTIKMSLNTVTTCVLHLIYCDVQKSSSETYICFPEEEDDLLGKLWELMNHLIYAKYTTLADLAKTFQIRTSLLCACSLDIAWQVRRAPCI
jgi:hypothetical protein